MPNLFECLGYKIYFWSNENSEPIHVHISKGIPSQNSTKVWITKNGGCIVANNSSRIPQKELNDLLETISINYFLIVAEWKKFFRKRRYNILLLINMQKNRLFQIIV